MTLSTAPISALPTSSRLAPRLKHPAECSGHGLADLVADLRPQLLGKRRGHGLADLHGGTTVGQPSARAAGMGPASSPRSALEICPTMWDEYFVVELAGHVGQGGRTFEWRQIAEGRSHGRGEPLGNRDSTERRNDVGDRSAGNRGLAELVGSREKVGDIGDRSPDGLIRSSQGVFVDESRGNLVPEGETMP